MFSKGQIYFAIFFVIAFSIAMVWSYRKDINLHKLHYKNTAGKVFIGGVLVAVIFVLARLALK